MTLKSIEKYFARYTEPRAYPWVSEMLHDIQDEVDSSYMELPVDADGVPIRVGDVMENFRCPPQDAVRLTVAAVGINSFAIEEETMQSTDEYWRHYNPRTIEDVLVDMLETAVGYSDAHTTVALGAVERYAAELRDLMGVDE